MKIAYQGEPGAFREEAFVGIARFHQAVEIEPLDLGKAFPHVADHGGARGSQRVRKRRGALSL